MIILKILYGLIIEPIYILLEFVFARAYKMINLSSNAEGLAIIVLSLAVNLLVLPLYKRADRIQNEERDKVARLKPGVDHIKKSFRGDERFMMLQTYYRQNNYSPILALRSSLSIILEIPFFLAAYSFLSDLAVLQNKSFGPIANLGKADQLIRIGGLSINLLPLLMTAFNIVSGLIYTKGLPLKNKIQFIGIAIIFLVLLYTSPAGLVFYWTLNNLFSLCKNLIDRQKNPKLIAFILCSIAGAGLFVLGSVTFASDFGMEKVFIMWVGLMAQIPIGAYFYRKKNGKKERKIKKIVRDQGVFFLSGLVITVLVGALIPSMVIKSSPTEFIDINDFHTSMRYIGYTITIATGLFLLWFSVFYKMAKETGKTIFSYVMLLLVGISVVNTMGFRGEYGNLSNYLKYDRANITPTLGELGVNILVNTLVSVVLLVLLHKSNRFVKRLLLVVFMALVILSTINIRVIIKEETSYAPSAENAPSAETLQFSLSKNDKNVVVIMLDRAISSYYPYLINENPKLREQFSGFTFYPNTISYGPCTNLGAPGIFGGYEYTPEEMNRRDSEKLADKHTEALKVMPVLFEGAGFDVTVIDPVYAGYHWIPDLSVFDDYPKIKTAISKGVFAGRWCVENGYNPVPGTEGLRKHNFFMYSILRSAPVLVNDVLYDYGNYNNMVKESERKLNSVSLQHKKNISVASGITRSFIDNYATLYYLKDMTSVNENEQGTFLMMVNDTTHEPMLLSEPDYSIQSEIDNREYDEAHSVRYDDEGNALALTTTNQMEHYHANMAVMCALGEWFDYLREEDVYDNTRIILVSDHGRDLGLKKYLFGEEKYEDVMNYMALLLVKDYEETEQKTDYRFMTNADTPLLAMEGIIEEPQNPFTGKPMTDEIKKQSEQHVAYSEVWSITENNGNKFQHVTWLAVQNNALDMSAWRVMEESR